LSLRLDRPQFVQPFHKVLGCVDALREIDQNPVIKLVPERLNFWSATTPESAKEVP
jgi:hypothetical protein